MLDLLLITLLITVLSGPATTVTLSLLLTHLLAVAPSVGNGVLSYAFDVDIVQWMTRVL